MPTTVEAQPALTPDPRFATPADDDAIERTAEALRAEGYDVHAAPDREAARRIVLELVPPGAEVGRYPLEDARARAAYGIGSAINKIVVVDGEVAKGRIGVVLIRDAIGF